MLVADRYRLDAPIGRGGMGEVWRATDEVLGRPVAVKLLLGDGSDPSAAARFRLEAQTAARLGHPHVVAVFDFGAWDGRFFLVMELVDGDSLAQLLEAGHMLGAERVAAVAAQAAAGLAAAHQQGIVHRDIKPGNLMLDTAGSLKIGDFGIARFVDDPAAGLTMTGQIVGTSLYLAPERALGQTAGPASDVYALGCVLYQLLTGRAPFQGDSATALLYQHIDSAPVPPSLLGADLPSAFEEYLLGLLAKQPGERPTAQDVADWFRTDAWRAHAVPSPAVLPPHGAPDPAGHRAGTAALVRPPAVRPASRRRAAPAQRRSAGEFIRYRPRVASAIAGVVAFVVAVILGMIWFSPESSSAKTPTDRPGATPTQGTGSAPGAGTPSDDRNGGQGGDQGGDDAQDED
ncbi:serine/threonine-protein kinase [Actinacidiphila sp. bgisy160]|uniref:serine/threonine-protein kinase n=1 Tax=Actinacidiphila sp. bgisy160 TaxID=3413796 RepID=UPI003D73C9C9